MIECPDFTLDMLLWASKMAYESGIKALLTSVLGLILETCSTNPRNLEQVDLLVLLRCGLLRMLSDGTAHPHGSGLLFG